MHIIALKNKIEYNYLTLITIYNYKMKPENIFPDWEVPRTFSELHRACLALSKGGGNPNDLIAGGFANSKVQGIINTWKNALFLSFFWSCFSPAHGGSTSTWSRT